MMRKSRPEKEIKLDLSKESKDICAWYGCLEDATYPAPIARTPQSLDGQRPELIFFCLGHIRDYNLGWDYFSGMKGHEIEKFQKEAITGHRPTKKIRPSVKPRFKGSHPLFNIDEIFEFGDESKIPERRLPTPEREALAVLDLEHGVSLIDIKEKYKQLARKYHPDANNGNRESEEKFKNINQAYNLLKNSSYFA